ncbi:branched-chain amino acid transport system II carrier protein, partial [Bacillus pumilus]|uniref:branched-chain amino acid transport system II carrier protein n=1 Tax=Bacillus pumilus TaxID=1408 RepID=UPI0016432131
MLLWIGFLGISYGVGLKGWKVVDGMGKILRGILVAVIGLIVIKGIGRGMGGIGSGHAWYEGRAVFSGSL